MDDEFIFLCLATLFIPLIFIMPLVVFEYYDPSCDFEEGFSVVVVGELRGVDGVACSRGDIAVDWRLNVDDGWYCFSDFREDVCQYDGWRFSYNFLVVEFAGTGKVYHSASLEELVDLVGCEVSLTFSLHHECESYSKYVAVLEVV